MRVRAWGGSRGDRQSPTLSRHPPLAARLELRQRCPRHARGGSACARTLKRYFAFGTIKPAEIGRRDISGRLERLNHAPSQKAHALVVIEMFFRWAMQDGYVEIDPAASFKRPKQRKRKRVLSDGELKAV